nr:transcriptional regulator, LysR family [uncultured bacterium]
MATRTLLDSRRLFYFYHVVKGGSFTAAEASLDVAQSALTRQIQQLESDIGVALLQRTGRGVVPTLHGQILFRHAESILDDMSAAIDEIDLSLSNRAGSLSIATPPSFSTLYMPEVIRRLLVEMPAIRLTVLEASTGQVHDHLASGEVDLAVVLHPPNSQKILLRKISTEPLRLITHVDHSIAQESYVSRAQIGALELILPAAAHGSRRLIEQYFDEGQMLLDAALRLDSLAITKAVIAQGPRFCSILPERTCKQEIDSGLFKALPLKPALIRSLHLARLRDRPETIYAKALAEQIIAVMGERFLLSD